MSHSFFKSDESNSVLMVENSQLLLENKFQFIHPYDMEPCQEIVDFGSKIDWDCVPFEDEEWHYMLNRQEYLLDLCLSFDVTGEVIYLKKVQEILLDWIADNQTDNNWRTIDTGIRLTYWNIALSYLNKYDLLDDVDRENVVKSISQQLTFLDDHYIAKYDLSNWGILITTGFFTIQLATDFLDETGISMRERMMERLTNQLRVQIQPSGNHWEQSPLYFMEVLRSLVCIHQSKVLKEEPIQQLLEEKILQMYHFMPHFVTPKGTTILQGDTDEMVIDNVMQTIAILYNQPLPVLFTNRVSMDYLLVYYSNQRVDYNDWHQDINQRLDVLFPNRLSDDYTGNYYYRTNWNSSASYGHLYNGSLGSGHGHLSLCHIDLSLNGNNLFVDSGRLTYTESNLRYALKEPLQHNTIEINGNPFGKVIDSWGYEDVPTSLFNRVYEDESFWCVRSMYIDPQHTGSYKVVRTLLYLKKLSSFVLIDQVIDFEGSHFSNMTRYFNINPYIDVDVTSDMVNLLSENHSYHAYFSEHMLSVDDSLYAPHYNELLVNKKITVTSEESSQYMVLTPHSDLSVEKGQLDKTDHQPVSDNKCYGVKVQMKGKTYLVYSMIEDTFSGHKLYTFDGYPIYGQCGVVELCENQPEKYTRIF